MKDLTLIAKTLVSHRGKSYARNHQFMASPDEAERFVKTGQAEVYTKAAAQSAPQAAAPKVDSK